MLQEYGPGVRLPWSVVAVVVSIAATVVGALLSNTRNDLNAVRSASEAQGTRLTVLETRFEGIGSQLQRIEKKLDTMAEKK